MEMYERLRYLRKELHLTQREVAEVLGVASNTYAMIETGRRTLKASYIKLLKYQFNINEEWLTDGIGEPFYISPQKVQLIERFDRLSPQMKEFYLHLSDELSELEEKIKKESLD